MLVSWESVRERVLEFRDSLGLPRTPEFEMAVSQGSQLFVVEAEDGLEGYGVLYSWKGRPWDKAFAVKTRDDHRHEVVQKLVQSAEEYCIGGETRRFLVTNMPEHLLGLLKSRGYFVAEEVIVMQKDDVAVPDTSHVHGTIRPFRAGDLDQVREVEVSAFNWLWEESPEAFLRYAAAERNSFFVLELDGKVIGYNINTLRDNGEAHIGRLAVARQYQGRGFGAKLLAQAVQYLRSQGATRFNLGTQADNLRSQRLYERFGFQKIGNVRYIVCKYL
ncbi:MAG: GNAT family N-acetyltransferase [Bacillota bacterium]